MENIRRNFAFLLKYISFLRKYTLALVLVALLDFLDDLKLASILHV